jgi:cell division inhibitor SulA
MRRYLEIPGSFNCHTCKLIVKNLRFYRSSLDITWLCENRHLSKVNLNVRGY